MKKLLTLSLLIAMILSVGCSNNQVKADQVADCAEENVFTFNSEIVDIYEIYFDTEFDHYYIIADGWAIELDELETTKEMMFADQIEVFFDQNDQILGYEFQ